LFIGYCFGEIVFGTAMSIKKVFFLFLFMNVISGRLKGIIIIIISPS